MKFAIILDDPDQEVAKSKILKAFPTAYQINDFVYLVEDERTTQDITNAIGMGPDGHLSGLVVRVNSWSGWTDNSIWEWFAKGRDS